MSLRDELEMLYAHYNRRDFISPDPLEHVLKYTRVEDREVAALIASCLAFGNVRQIGRSVTRALAPLGDAPAAYVQDVLEKELEAAYRGFKHRWIDGSDMVQMLLGIRGAIREYGSLSRLFYAKIDDSDGDVIPALSRFVGDVRRRSRGFRACLLPSPGEGSACKRLHLFLRWMVRSDEVDPGGWDEISPSMLVVPLDIHLFRVCSGLGLTHRRRADCRTAREATDAFRRLAPDDPVKYDFGLTRLGIRRDDDDGGFVKMLGLQSAVRRSRRVRTARECSDAERSRRD
jgi:uncharacterized protein (TIGR02757 family)